MRAGFAFTIVLTLAVCAAGLPSAGAGQADDPVALITAAAPDQPYTQPQKPRKLLVFTLCRGFRHGCIPVGTQALEILGKKTGAFEAVHSEDIAMFEPERLAQFDAVCMLNTTGELFLPPDLEGLSPAERAKAEKRDARLKQSLLDFVKSGKGLVGIHAATDCFYNWSEYGEMMGGYFHGHPWNEEVVLKLDDPDHPLNTPFGGRPFVVTDEIYQFKEPYSRERLRVLLSLDTARTDMNKKGIHRTDNDFAVSWVRDYGQGRVFYCSLGHRDEIFWNPKVLRHYLAGIQFALGDLPADARPSAKPMTSSWTPLFNGKDLSGWKALVGNPAARAGMSPEELAEKQANLDLKMHVHWTARDGVLIFDGQGSNICTAKDYGNFELKVDWKIEPGGDSGIYLRGSPQVQIWDAAQHPEGSGGLYNNQHDPSKPLVRADKPVGQWNTFQIRMIGERVCVWLNDQLVAENVVLENYWERGKPIYPSGQIELQAHGGPVCFRNIMIRDLTPEEIAADRNQANWRELFNGRDLTGWTCKDGSWVVEDGALTRKGGGDIWTREQFGDFVLELEFKLAEGTNSGIFFRTADIKDCVQTGIELQVLDSYGKDKPGKHDCGAIYDIQEPRANAVRKAGEWNHVVLSCRGSEIAAIMNGEPVIAMNLDQWTEPHKNPDGTPNKFKTAYKDMPRAGHIGFQDHGKPVWYRNIRIKPLKAQTSDARFQ